MLCVFHTKWAPCKKVTALRYSLLHTICYENVLAKSKCKKYRQIEYLTLAPELSENISSLKMMGPAETEEIDSLISVSACNTAAVKNKVALSILMLAHTVQINIQESDLLFWY